MRVVESNWKEPPPCFWKVIAWVAESSRGQEIGSPRVHKGQVGSQSQPQLKSRDRPRPIAFRMRGRRLHYYSFLSTCMSPESLESMLCSCWKAQKTALSTFR